MAYSKIILKEEILHSDLPENKHFLSYIESEFPKPLRQKYRRQMENHRLHREIIATQFSNDLVNDMGFAFIHQMYDETSAEPANIVCAYVAARAIFKSHELWEEIETLDGQIDNQTQKDMMIEVVRLVRRATRWLLRNRPSYHELTKTIDLFSKQTEQLYDALPRLLVGEEAKYCEERKNQLIAAKLPAKLATKMALIRTMYSALNIIEAATQHKLDLYKVAAIYFKVADRLDLVWFREQINSFDIVNHWTVLARAAYKGDLDWLQRELAVSVLRYPSVEQWLEKQSRFVARWQSLLADLKSGSNKDFAMLTVAMRELTDLAQAN